MIDMEAKHKENSHKPTMASSLRSLADIMNSWMGTDHTSVRGEKYHPTKHTPEGHHEIDDSEVIIKNLKVNDKTIKLRFVIR